MALFCKNGRRAPAHDATAALKKGSGAAAPTVQHTVLPTVALHLWHRSAQLAPCGPAFLRNDVHVDTCLTDQDHAGAGCAGSARASVPRTMHSGVDSHPAARPRATP